MSPNDITPKVDTKSNLTFSKVTSMTRKQNNHQAIIIDNTIDADFEECLVALLDLIPPSSIILDASILSGNRIVVFLDSEKTVDELIDSKKTIIVSDHVLQIRPYVPRKKRITFNHVFPQVDDSLLESELKKCDIKILDPIKKLNANFRHPRLKHVRNLRRETYIALEDIDKLPSKIISTVEGKEIHIYITTETTPSKCSSCKLQGHSVKKCPSKTTRRIVNVNVNKPRKIPQQESNATIQSTTLALSPPENSKKSSSPTPPSKIEKSTKVSPVDPTITSHPSPSASDQEYETSLNSSSDSEDPSTWDNPPGLNWGKLEETTTSPSTPTVDHKNPSLPSSPSNTKTSPTTPSDTTKSSIIPFENLVPSPSDDTKDKKPEPASTTDHSDDSEDLDYPPLEEYPLETSWAMIKNDLGLDLEDEEDLLQVHQKILPTLNSPTSKQHLEEQIREIQASIDEEKQRRKLVK